MSDDKKGILASFSDNTKVNFFRWWIQGAIYFLIAWGTNLGLNEDAFDLIFTLGLATAVVHIFIFDPIVYGMFEIERNGVIINKKVNERKVWEGVLYKLVEFFHSFLTVVLVFLTYQLINTIAIKVFSYHESELFLTGEPILYATFFLLIYNLLTLIGRLVFKLYKKISRKEEIK